MDHKGTDRSLNPWAYPSFPMDLVTSKDCNIDLICDFLIQHWQNVE